MIGSCKGIWKRKHYTFIAVATFGTGRSALGTFLEIFCVTRIAWRRERSGAVQLWKRKPYIYCCRNVWQWVISFGDPFFYF